MTTTYKPVQWYSGTVYVDSLTLRTYGELEMCYKYIDTKKFICVVQKYKRSLVLCEFCVIYFGFFFRFLKIYFQQIFWGIKICVFFSEKIKICFKRCKENLFSCPNNRFNLVQNIVKNKIFSKLKCNPKFLVATHFNVIFNL